MKTTRIHPRLWINRFVNSIPVFALLAIALMPTTGMADDPPGILNHQGRVAVDNINHDGPGHFKFSLVKDAGLGTEAILSGTMTALASESSNRPVRSI